MPPPRARGPGADTRHRRRVELCPTSRLTLVLLLLRGQADAAVTMAAAINMTEPCMTGIGSDCFCLLFDAETGRVKGLNGSGP